MYRKKLRKKLASIMLVAVMVAGLLPIMDGKNEVHAEARTGVAGEYTFVIPKYADDPGTTSSPTVITSSTTTVTLGSEGTESWYVVKDDVTISKYVKVLGDVNIILMDGYTLEVTYLYISGAGHSLTFWGQNNGTGTIKTTSAEGAAGIGVWNDNSLTINGGTVIAKGGTNGAGIGSDNRRDGSNITINGGTVTATGGKNGAGIGAGNGWKGSNITINGGTVTATGGESGAGIGGGNGGKGSNITINGGSVTAIGCSGAAGIGGGNGGEGSNITINGGNVTAKCENESGGAGIGGGKNNDGSNITIKGGIVTANGGLYGAGIGGGYRGNGSNITINGGTVTSTGGEHGAGIGGGYNYNSQYGLGKDITITGGSVTATGGLNGAGIGGGESASGSNITITGGSVTATGGTDGMVQGAGIGGGNGGSGSNIIISRMLVKAGDSANPTSEVPAPEDRKYDSLLSGKRFAKLELICFTISKAETINGSFTVNEEAEMDSEVTVTPSPELGYEVDTVSFNDGISDTSVTKTGDVYSFIIPNKNVTVKVTFKAIPAGEKKLASSKKGTDTTPDVEITAIDITRDIPFSEELRTAIITGKSVDVFLQVSDAGVSDADKKLITESVLVKGYTIGKYIDIDLFAMVSGDESTKTSITNTNNEIEFSIKLPKELINADKEQAYAILRLHNGMADIVESSFDSATGTLKAKSDKYSSYAILYKDATATTGKNTATEESPTTTEESPTTSVSPDTGDSSPILPMLAVMMIAGAGFIACGSKKRQRQ